MKKPINNSTQATAGAVTTETTSKAMLDPRVCLQQNDVLI
jgi:hypothetical protein